ncbi:YcnI family protein [Streptantibioticus ferralitis]|uniref:YcnI family protein n=1 Tax=Streptantibioticus ferralitis TaxID=236510 RepID=A0ABT5Z1D8_9ACTN|nr:YcnI family protein [Streptantibioticus ferralitis]MDF2257386.1 YcnI family protein [Streptantibioticus ferralitis]
MTISRKPAVSRLAAVGAAAGASVLLLAAPAFAHVTVSPSTAAKGGYSTVDFKVPNEQDNANTVKVEVDFPADHPLASVQTEPVPGWTATVTKTKLAKPITTDDGQVTEAVTKITWSGGQIKPGEFQQFPVALGPLPSDTGKLVFKALQTYDNNQVVRWIDASTPGGAEPAHPAPTITLTDAKSGDATQATAQQSAAPASSSGGSDTTARVLAVVGIVVGAAGIGYGVLAGRRRGSAA